MAQWEDLPGGRTVHHFYRNQSTLQLRGLARDCFGTVGKMQVRKLKSNIQENATETKVVDDIVYLFR